MRQSWPGHVLDFAYDAGGRAVGFNHNGAPYFYLRNLQNDVVAIMDAEGTIVAEYAYDAYGNVLSETGPMAAINPIKYRGYYHDAETNWYWLETRYYVPQWRRFLNADTFFVAGEDMLNGSNMYAYCNGNPVMFVDPTGQGIVDVLRKAWDGFLNGMTAIVDGATQVVQTIKEAMDSLSDLWMGIGNGLMSLSRIVEAGIPFYEMVHIWASGVFMPGLTDFLSPLANFLGNDLSGKGCPLSLRRHFGW